MQLHKSSTRSLTNNSQWCILFYLVNSEIFIKIRSKSESLYFTSFVWKCHTSSYTTNKQAAQFCSWGGYQALINGAWRGPPTPEREWPLSVAWGRGLHWCCSVCVWAGLEASLSPCVWVHLLWMLVTGLRSSQMISLLTVMILDTDQGTRPGCHDEGDDDGFSKASLECEED